MKNQDLFLFVLLAIFGFLIWNQSVGEKFVDVSASTPVSPAVIQNIITSIQDKDSDLYPLQTVYINPFGGDQGSMIYNARIIFLNTRGYFGVQYDVQADASGRIINMNSQAHPDALGPFKPYTEDKYESFDDVQMYLDKQFSDLKSQVPGFQGKLEGWLQAQNANQKKSAALAARGSETLEQTTKDSETGKYGGYVGAGALDYSSAVFA
jgi:hypothetical protein